MSEGHEAVTRALTERMHRAIGQKVKQLELGLVRRVTPQIEVEMFESHHVLVENTDFVLTQFVRWWNQNYAIQPDDVLVMVGHVGGERYAFDVQTDRPVAAGPRMNRPPAVAGGDVQPLLARSESGLFTMGAVPPGGGTPTVTWNHHIVAGVPVYDKDGVFLGYCPVFASLPA